jgi:hypothetical protein
MAMLSFGRNLKMLPVRRNMRLLDGNAHNLAASNKQKEAYDTAYSQAVTHPSTNAAQSCLTSVIGRELVFSTWYGRRHEQEF